MNFVVVVVIVLISFIQLVGLTSIAKLPTLVYSGGEKRRLSVALGTTFF
jgi:hypothetical protein